VDPRRRRRLVGDSISLAPGPRLPPIVAAAAAAAVAAALESLHKLGQLVGGVGQGATRIAHSDITHTDIDANADAHTHILGHSWQRRLMVHAVIVHSVVRWSLRRRRMAHHMVRRGLGPVSI